MVKIKLKEWADKHGLSYITANRHFHAGLIPGANQLDSGTILVEDNSPEQTMAGNTTSDVMSLFLKKTVEFSKNGSSIEDFAAYILSNFSLKINGVSEGPKYSRKPPKAEEVQKHFQQFIPKGEKPKPNSFVPEPDTLKDLEVMKEKVDPEELAQVFKVAVEGSPYPVDTQMNFTVKPVSAGLSAVSQGGEGVVTQSVDFNTTPQQQINYTGSNNPTFTSSLAYVPPTTTATVNPSSLLAGSTLQVATTSNALLANNSATFGIVGSDETSYSEEPTGAYFVNSFSLTQKELQSATKATTELNQPRKRGRKPIKR